MANPKWSSVMLNRILFNNSLQEHYACGLLIIFLCSFLVLVIRFVYPQGFIIDTVC